MATTKTTKSMKTVKTSKNGNGHAKNGNSKLLVVNSAPKQLIGQPIVEVSEQYGATLNMEPDSRFKPLRFGARKAKLILQHLDIIRQFVVEYGDK